MIHWFSVGDVSTWIFVACPEGLTRRCNATWTVRVMRRRFSLSVAPTGAVTSLRASPVVTLTRITTLKQSVDVA